jgi:hypothetical protein
MIESVADLLAVCDELYGGEELPKPLGILKACFENSTVANARLLASSLRTSSAKLNRVLAASDPLRECLGVSLDAQTDEAIGRARSILGQLLLGALAESAFEELYRARIGSDDLRLEDRREGRTETDYRVLNGEGRQVFRLNIKFHGTRFERARDLVGLDPDDCFALATYKIHQAEARERAEVSPYVFAIVSAPGMTAERAGLAIPERFACLAAIVSASKLPGKRSVEDRIIARIVASAPGSVVSASVDEFADRIRSAPWRLLSARKAKRLLQELLFERVYAVRVRAFARNYRNAEVDMHFSLDSDMTSIDDFLRRVKERGIHGITALLTAGHI